VIEEMAMRNSLLAAAAAVLVGSVGASGTASAQGLGIYIGPPPAYTYEYYGYAPGYTYYEYAPEYDAVEVRRYRRAGRCGTYRYWDGARCVDARSGY
jgi:hypothetical protein